MATKILITGEPRVGKTTLFERLLLDFNIYADGFLTKEILNDNQERVGFEIVSIEKKIKKTLAHVDIKSDFMVGKYFVDTDIIDSHAIPEIEKALKRKKILFIDEIGSMELNSLQFRKIVFSAFNDPDQSIIATVHKRGESFTNSLKEMKDVFVFEIDEGNRVSMLEKIKGIMQKEIDSYVENRLTIQNLLNDSGLELQFYNRFSKKQKTRGRCNPHRYQVVSVKDVFTRTNLIDLVKENGFSAKSCGKGELGEISYFVSIDLLKKSI